MPTKTPKKPLLVVDALKHEGATRKNIPTAEYQSVMAEDEQNPRPVAYERAGNQGLEEEKAARVVAILIRSLSGGGKTVARVFWEGRVIRRLPRHLGSPIEQNANIKVSTMSPNRCSGCLRSEQLKARMNADLHMADDLKNTGKGNLFVIFGEPDITILDAADGQIEVKVNGVDVFHPNTGEVRSDGAEGIACWFIDTDYNEESFFVRHAYFLGANDPYKSLKITLKAETDPDAWATLNSDTSRPFAKPKSGRIAVKVINHLGDEVMKVFRIV